MANGILLAPVTAFDDVCAGGNLRPATVEQIEALYRALLQPAQTHPVGAVPPGGGTGG